MSKMEEKLRTLQESLDQKNSESKELLNHNKELVNKIGRKQNT